MQNFMLTPALTAAMLLLRFTWALSLVEFPAAKHQFDVPLLACGPDRTHSVRNVPPRTNHLPSKSWVVGLFKCEQ